MTLFLIGARARYADELQSIVGDLGISDSVFVDNLIAHGDENLTTPRPIDDLLRRGGSYLLCPSPPGIRARLARELAHTAAVVHSALVHPSSSVSANTQIEAGSTVNRLVSVGVHTKIGEHCQINRSVSVGHDCHLSGFVTVGPSAVITSGVSISAGAFVGAGAVLLPGICVGHNSIVGAGAIVTADVPDYATVVGNPAVVKSVSHSGYKGFSV